MEKYRQLSSDEIAALENRRCRADDWRQITVKNGFTPAALFDVHLSGRVRLGNFTKNIDTGSGQRKATGIRHSYIKNCTIGDNVYISDVKNLINYEIDEEVVVENVGRLQVEGRTTFGNGIDIEVLNANGNRKFPMFDLLSAQLAYLMTTYRQNARFNKKLDTMIERYVQGRRRSSGIIGRRARISDCLKIVNVSIGAAAVLSGATSLYEGSVNSHELAPVRIGDGVIAGHFIIQSGSSIDSGALLDKSLIGQGVQVGKQFSAENSLIFSNSECFHGEACNIFAGPFTVTHHKSTLLIAAMFSFFNAGSGSNQSNHMYKLGPIHQGIVERGSKTGSFSYLLWPSRIGAFSIVIGKHIRNFDSALFPFSYILEDQGQTNLVPAINFFTAGTKRDSTKWQSRDRRSDPDKLDVINFHLLSPFIIEKVIKALDILKDLETGLDENAKVTYYEGMQIERARLKKAIQDYQTILQIYYGEEVLRFLEQQKGTLTNSDLERLLQTDPSFTGKHWIDAAGMVVPIEEIHKIFRTLGSPSLSSIEDLQTRFRQIGEGYEKTARQWCLATLGEQLAVPAQSLNSSQLISIIENWREASQHALKRILKDAAKEFSSKSRIGYGINGDETMRELEFEAIVGRFEDNPHVKALQAELAAIPARAEQMIRRLKKIKSKKPVSAA